VVPRSIPIALPIILPRFSADFCGPVGTERNPPRFEMTQLEWIDRYIGSPNRFYNSL
jgi:hypothetical protein